MGGQALKQLIKRVMIVVLLSWEEEGNILSLITVILKAKNQMVFELRDLAYHGLRKKLCLDHSCDRACEDRLVNIQAPCLLPEQPSVTDQMTSQSHSLSLLEQWETCFMLGRKQGRWPRTRTNDLPIMTTPLGVEIKHRNLSLQATQTTPKRLPVHKDLTSGLSYGTLDVIT